MIVLGHKISFFILILIGLVFKVYGQQEKLPYIAVIVADDLGYRDLQSYGNKFIKTPNLENLADERIKYTNCYASSPMCSPSRAGLLTGGARYRIGVYDSIAPDSTMSCLKRKLPLRNCLKAMVTILIVLENGI